MDRRTFIRKVGALTGGAAAGAAGLAAPAIAQSLPTLKWRLTSSYPTSFDTLYGATVDFARWVTEATDGRFEITVYPVGEIAGFLDGIDEVGAGRIEMCQTASYYFTGKDPAFAFGTTIPFGLNSRQQNAWMYSGGGIEAMNALYKRFNLYGLPAGNTGAQMGGWFRKEINSLDDLTGLRMRIPGLGGAVLAKLGVEPVQLGGADTYRQLADGKIDAAEWVGPYDDLTLRLHEAAPYYYYPGWWDGCGMLSVYTNLDLWNELPKAYQTIVASAAAYANAMMQARYDALSPPALRTLVAEGAQLRAFSPEILKACFEAANEVLAETSAASEAFRGIYEPWQAFRKEEVYWFQFAEESFDNYMAAEERAGRL